MALMILPKRDGSVLGFDEALAEKMFKNILQVQEPMVLELQLDELGRSGLVATRNVVASQPELVMDHRIQKSQSEGTSRQRREERAVEEKWPFIWSVQPRKDNIRVAL